MIKESPYLKSLRYKSFRNIYFLNVLLVIIIVLCLTALIHLHRSYSSDDTALPNYALRVINHQAGGINVGEDNFILKLPVYMLLEMTGISPRHVLLIANILFMSALVVLVVWFIHRTVNKISPFAYLWLFGGSIGFLELLLNATTRNIEIILSIILSYSLYVSIQKYPSSLKGYFWNYLPYILAVGILSYHDMFLMYFVFMPLALYTVISSIRNQLKRKDIVKLCCLATILLCAMLFRAGVDIFIKTIFDIHIARDSSVTTLTPVNDLIPTVIKSLISIAKLMGIAPEGEPLKSGKSLLIMFSILPLFVVASSLTSKIIRNIFSYTLARIALFTVIINVIVLSALQYGSENPLRYYVLIPFYLFILLAFWIRQVNFRVRVLFFTTVSLLVTLNIIYSVTRIHTQKMVIDSEPFNNYSSSQYPQNYPTREMIKKASDLGIKVGYGGYWQSNITEYLSNNTIAVQPLTCVHSKTLARFNWWHINEDPKARAIKGPSFLIIDTATPAESSDNCYLPEELQIQFGQAKEIIKISTYTSMVIYNYNIGEKL